MISAASSASSVAAHAKNGEDQSDDEEHGDRPPGAYAPEAGTLERAYNRAQQEGEETRKRDRHEHPRPQWSAATMGRTAAPIR
jgi:hypothetical protein